MEGKGEGEREKRKGERDGEGGEDGREKVNVSGNHLL